MSANYEKLNPYTDASAPYQGNDNNIPIAVATVVEEPITAEAVYVDAVPTVHPSTTSPISIQLLSDLGREPVDITCPYCMRTGRTRVRDNFDSGSFVWGLCCCLFGFWPCAILPCCVKTVRISTECNALLSDLNSSDEEPSFLSMYTGPTNFSPYFLLSSTDD